MIGPSNLLVVVLLGLATLACSPKDSLSPNGQLPVDTWAVGAAQLSPDPDGFRLTGLCCAYLIIPQIALDQNRQFTIKASYHAYTGAGYSSIPATASGQLSTDGMILTLTYSVGSDVRTLQMRPGSATIAIDCACF